MHLAFTLLNLAAYTQIRMDSGHNGMIRVDVGANWVSNPCNQQLIDSG